MTEHKADQTTDWKKEMRPVIIDLGKHRSKQVKKLRRGEGKLMGDVQAAIEELKHNGVIHESVQPVIIIVGQKPKNGWNRLW